MIALPQSFLSPEAYLQLEQQSQTKQEYINGAVYAMAGASDAHVTIAGNLFARLLNHLRGGGCRVYIADMKVRILDRNCFYYPDVMVTCNPQDQTTPTYKQFPKLIVEVLSDSTEAFDRGDIAVAPLVGAEASQSVYPDFALTDQPSPKGSDQSHRFADYQTLESLEEYVLINTRHQRIECFRRDSGGRWLLQTYTETTPWFELQSVDFADSLATIYEDVILESTPPGERFFYRA